MSQLPVQPGLFERADVQALDRNKYFEIAWASLPVKSRAGLERGEITELIYQPFAKYLYCNTGLFDFFLSLYNDPRKALEHMIEKFSPTTYERWVRGKLAGCEKDEERLEEYNESLV